MIYWNVKEMNRKCTYALLVQRLIFLCKNIVTEFSRIDQMLCETLINVPAYTLADSKFGMAKAVFWCHFFFLNNYWSFLLLHAIIYVYLVRKTFFIFSFFFNVRS